MALGAPEHSIGKWDLLGVEFHGNSEGSDMDEMILLKAKIHRFYFSFPLNFWTGKDPQVIQFKYQI